MLFFLLEFHDKSQTEMYFHGSLSRFSSLHVGPSQLEPHNITIHPYGFPVIPLLVQDSSLWPLGPCYPVHMDFGPNLKL